MLQAHESRHVALKNTAKSKILHYHRLYADRPDPFVLVTTMTVKTSVRSYDDLVHLLFLDGHRKDSTLTNELGVQSFSIPSHCLLD
jgi:hypothetical protein